MIVYPVEWYGIGMEIELPEIDGAILDILQSIDCSSLSFSGGIDSSLLLYYLLKLNRKVRAFTIVPEADHPDVLYSRMVVQYLEKEFDVYIERHLFVSEKGEAGDLLVQEFYSKLRNFTDSIIAGDGVDEFMAGYYDHQKMPSEEIYYRYLRQLQSEHLIPLNDNSGEVRVYLPYIDKRLVYLMSQIPLIDKVDLYERKKVMVELAKGKLPQEVIERKKYGFCTSCRKVLVHGGKG